MTRGFDVRPKQIFYILKKGNKRKKKLHNGKQKTSQMATDRLWDKKRFNTYRYLKCVG